MQEAADATAPQPRRHILTFALEDYFQAGALDGVVQLRQWPRFEKRVEQNARAALDLLEACSAKATFFVLGWIAQEMPELVREIVERGHEVASKGYHHRSLRQMDAAQFRDDVVRSREVIERAAGRRVLGYRVGYGSFGLADLWALDVLAEEGFAYDSSFYPRLRSIGGDAWRRFPFEHRSSGRSIWEVPLSSLRVAGLSIPVAGGNYFRQLPHGLAQAVLRRWTERDSAPFVLHFHVWELDAELPHITAASWLRQLRQHRNTSEMPQRIDDHLRTYQFTSIADHLGLCPNILPEPACPPECEVVALASTVSRLPVTVVVPCHNEEVVLPYLSNTLDDVKRRLGRAYDLRFLFVDDGSSDATWAVLQRIFGARPDCTILQHARNMGVAQAILTGIRAANTEAVCSIDCDCTYDPQQLETMLPLFQDGVDLVTASPYHRLGSVLNVPGWRLFLSKGLSRLYRLALGQDLATFTSCFRVYRRSAFADLQLREKGFLGVAEMVAVLAVRRARVVECPAVLEARMLGRSKMKVVRTIAGHLRLLSRYALVRFRRQATAAPQGAASKAG